MGVNTESDSTSRDAVVESPKGSRNTYLFDQVSGRIRLEHSLFTATCYPVDYGCLPGTMAEDGAPMRVLVLLEESTFPGCHITVRPVGVLWVDEGGKRRATILAVPATDPRFSYVQDIGDVDRYTLDEIRHFFDVYQQLDPGACAKTVGWDRRDRAVDAISAALGRHLAAALR